MCFPQAQSESISQDFSETGGGVIGGCLQPDNNDKLNIKTINNVIAVLIFMLIPRVIIYKNGNLARLKKVMKNQKTY
jgi:Tfp pilus assembly ATPase PilU